MRRLFNFTILLLLLISCKKDIETTPTTSTVPPKTTDYWYIYEWYSQMDGATTQQMVGLSGIDHKLDFRTDGTIYYHIQNVPNDPAFWGYHTSSTVTFGTGGSGSMIYQIISQSSSELKAKNVSPGVTFYLTLKK